MAIHVVKNNENLWSISQYYGIPISEIMEINGLNSANSIVPGLAIYIPSDQPYIRNYQIKTGDTIWKVAQQYNTTVTAILMENPQLNPNYLQIGQRLAIPTEIKLRMNSIGFIAPYSQESFLKNFRMISDQLTYLAVAAFSLTAEGYVYVQLNDNDIVAASKEQNVIPLLMIRNLEDEKFSAELVGRVLQNPEFRTHLVDSIIQLTTQKGYGGVSVDFEFIPPQRRNDFLIFLRQLKTALGSLLLHVNIHAKSEDLPTNRIVGAYDYKEIGNIADLVAVMTIDYGYPTGPPDPIAPIWWVEQVVQYSIKNIPASKLQISFPLYGYDKVVSTNTTRSLSLKDSQNQAIRLGATIQFDSNAQAPWYRYWRNSEEHIVWFEDSRSFQEKYNLIDIYQIAGATFWQIMLPAPWNWAFMRDQIDIIKI